MAHFVFFFGIYGHEPFTDFFHLPCTNVGESIFLRFGQFQKLLGWFSLWSSPPFCHFCDFFSTITCDNCLTFLLSMCITYSILWHLTILYKQYRTWPGVGVSDIHLNDIYNPLGYALGIMNIILVYIWYTTWGHVLYITNLIIMYYNSF